MAAIAFDAVSAGLARQVDCVIVDTAGRLPTQLHLMEELKKVKRVMAKAMADAPHETWLVVDGGTGQNALAQVSSKCGSAKVNSSCSDGRYQQRRKRRCKT